MRLIVTTAKERHEEACTAVAVSLTGDILTGGDDFVVRRWNANGEAMGVVRRFDSCVTLVSWLPAAQVATARRGRGAGGMEGRDGCLVACADGTLVFVNVLSGRVERTVEAHTGGITGLVYTADASSIITAGEDGCVKVWSQAGIPRSTLVSAGKCIYTLCYGTETIELGGECVLYGVSGDVIIKPLNPSVKKQLKWKAHNGVVLCADWSRMSGLIVTGGEDGAYSVWDPYGRNIFTCVTSAQPVTSVRFSADGEMFAVGSFATLRVCDKTGWSHTCERVAEGSVMAVQWMPDGTQMVAGCGSGAVCMAQTVDSKILWGSYAVTLVDSRRLLVQDVSKEDGGDVVEELPQRDKVIKLGVGHGYIVVCTTTACICYPVKRVTAPVQFDLHDAVITLKLGATHFLLADCSQGIQLYSYEGRQISVLRLQVTLRPEILSADLLSLSPDTVALRNPADSRQVLFFDAASGKPVEGRAITHGVDIVAVQLSQSGPLAERKVVFVDRNRDLHLAVVHQGTLGAQKISTMVTSVAWHDVHETLVAIADGHLTVWYYPAILFTERDLLPLTREVRGGGVVVASGTAASAVVPGATNATAAEAFSPNDRISTFHDTRIQVRRGSDGALLTFAIVPYPIIVMQLVEAKDWESATRLARFLRLPLVWAVLVGLALRQGELNVAEVAYGALSELAKVRYIHELKNIPSPEGRQAELALFQHRAAEAERILLQAGLIYRCIDMHTRLYNWERALAIATERKTHVDTVLGRRQRYLAELGRKETLPAFKSLAESIKVDWTVIDEKVKQERIKEAERPNARPYQ